MALIIRPSSIPRAIGIRSLIGAVLGILALILLGIGWSRARRLRSQLGPRLQDQGRAVENIMLLACVLVLIPTIIAIVIGISGFITFHRIPAETFDERILTAAQDEAAEQDEEDLEEDVSGELNEEDDAMMQQDGEF